MPRLFVAADLPDQVREHLLSIRPAPLPGMRLVSRHDLHLTLHFIGEVEDGYIPAILTALEKVQAPPFPLDLEGVGHFPEQGPARVLWAGVRASPQLTALHQAVGTALAAAIGFLPEERPYHPHVSLAWLDQAPPQETVEDYLDEHAGFRLAAVPISSFSLYSNRRSTQAPRYAVEATFALS
jgi:2'-5' RNA ligase